MMMVVNTTKRSSQLGAAIEKGQQDQVAVDKAWQQANQGSKRFDQQALRHLDFVIKLSRSYSNISLSEQARVAAEEEKARRKELTNIGTTIDIEG